MLILTNFERFPEEWTSVSGQSGRAKFGGTFDEFAKGAQQADLLLINCDIEIALRLSALFLLMPWRRKPIVAVDFVLRRPKKPGPAHWLKRFLLGRIDFFVHYFNDNRGYEKHFGISPRRSAFVPFKPNIRYRFDVAPDSEGKYILCLGRSMRDYDTFFKAVERLPWPAAIPVPDFAEMAHHETRFTRRPDQLPPNVTVLEDDGSPESMFRILEGARLVVLPILKASLCASGVSTYLNAMLMRKCVVITEGPGVSDVLTNQALICPSEDPEALVALIRRAWEDDDLRNRTADAGYRYALSLGGEPELQQRIIDAVFGHFSKT